MGACSAVSPPHWDGLKEPLLCPSAQAGVYLRHLKSEYGEYILSVGGHRMCVYTVVLHCELHVSREPPGSVF